MPLVTARHLTRSFGDRVAVRDVSFELRAGEIVALLGPNGAGKTTTMRMLAGLLAPTSGTVEIEGAPLTRQSTDRLRGRIGLLTETPGLWDRLSVEANLFVHAQLQGLREPAARVGELLKAFDLADRRRDPAGTLSKGMRQKVAIARALLHDPPVLLLDEPTAGLDPQMSRTVRGMIERMRAEGRVVLVSTHNLDEAERVADRVAVLQQSLIALERPETLRQRLFGQRVRIGLGSGAQGFAAAAAQAGAKDVRVEDGALVCGLEHPDDEIPAIVRALVTAGASVRSVVEERAALEDVYLSLLTEGDEAPRQGAEGAR